MANTITLNLHNVVDCDGCNILSIDLTEGEIYEEGNLIGAECLCGYWVSAYWSESLQRVLTGEEFFSE